MKSLYQLFKIDDPDIKIEDDVSYFVIDPEQSFHGIDFKNPIMDFKECFVLISVSPPDLSALKHTISYGIQHPVFCPGCRDKELIARKASDVNFGNISTDIVIIYCEKCKHINVIDSY